jgi:hypothetical protein
MDTSNNVIEKSTMVKSRGGPKEVHPRTVTEIAVVAKLLSCYFLAKRKV